MTTFKSFDLAAPIDTALEKLGYTIPTPIQAQAIPELLKGRDLMGIAQTGTGKTAAFALPTLHHLVNTDIETPKRGARVLVLAPTRELASQIAVSFRDYGRDIDYLTVVAVFGGTPLPKQIKRVSAGVDVLVATPGRLLDLIDRKALTLKDVEILILDEADQMMDMGFIQPLKKIAAMVPKHRQTLFFSATMAPKIANLAKQFLNDPIKVSITPANTTAERVDQKVIFVNQAEKPDLLALSLLAPGVTRSLVFTRTKHGADRVVKRLRLIGIAATAIHGNKSQAQRQRALTAFREDAIQVLVATDVAARGIDIEGITHVFNYEIPNVAEQYVHRIGRTARANASGTAIAFVAKDERKYLKDIHKLLKTDIPVDPLPEDFIAKAAQLKNRPPLPKEEKPAPPQRKGRGKSRKKGRFSKDQERKSERGEGKPSRPPRDHSDRPAKRSEGRPETRDRDDRPRSEKPRADKPRSDKPRRNTDDKPASGSTKMSKADFQAKLKKAQSQMSGDLKDAPARGRKKPAGKPGGKPSGKPNHGSRENRHSPASEPKRGPKNYSGKPSGGKPSESRGDKPSGKLRSSDRRDPSEGSKKGGPKKGGNATFKGRKKSGPPKASRGRKPSGKR